jgi:hypothetical protein
MKIYIRKNILSKRKKFLLYKTITKKYLCAIFMIIRVEKDWKAIPFLIIIIIIKLNVYIL